MDGSKLMRAGIALAAMLAGGIAVAQARPEFLFDLVRKPAYAPAWKAVLGAVPRNASAAFIGSLKGPATPIETLRWGGQNYLEAAICEQHNCADNNALVVIDATTRRMWIVHRTKGAAGRISRASYGGPDEGMSAFMFTRLAKAFPAS